MPLLASVADVRMRLTFDEGTTVDNAIEGALLATTPILESRLRTKFARVDAQEEIFQVTKVHSEDFPAATPYISSTRVRGGRFGREPLLTTELLLRRGFITETDKVNLTVEAATLIPHFDDSNLVWDLRTFEDGEDKTYTDPERGLITVHQVNLKGLFVKVTYNGGLTVASDDLYDLTDDQNWLHELAILNALMILDTNPVMRRDDNQEAFMDGIKNDYDILYRDHLRYVPSAVRPLAR